MQSVNDVCPRRYEEWAPERSRRDVFFEVNDGPTTSGVPKGDRSSE
jgi:hypothetical protein